MINKQLIYDPKQWRDWVKEHFTVKHYVGKWKSFPGPKTYPAVVVWSGDVWTEEHDRAYQFVERSDFK